MQFVVLSAVMFVSFGLFSQETDNEIFQIALKRDMCIERMQPYPNPSEGLIYLDAPEGSVCHVVNLNGQVLGSFTVDENGFYRDDLDSGTYIIFVQYGTEIFRRKFIVL